MNINKLCYNVIKVSKALPLHAMVELGRKASIAPTH
jgi:hypothetical protein